jgi:hypothetical protein
MGWSVLREFSAMWIEPSQAQEVLTEQKGPARMQIRELRKRLSRPSDEIKVSTDIAINKEKRNGYKTVRDGDAEGHLNTKAR